MDLKEIEIARVVTLIEKDYFRRRVAEIMNMTWFMIQGTVNDKGPHLFSKEPVLYEGFKIS